MKGGFCLVFLTAVASGFAIFINKFGVSAVGPSIYTFLRVLTVAVFLSVLLLIFRDWPKLKKLTKKQWLLLVLIGLVGGSVPFLIFFKGLSLTLAAKGAFIHKTMFIYVAILASLFLKEKIDQKFLFGGLILLIANLILLKRFSFEINRGDFLVFLATLLWAIENTISKYALKDLDGKIVAWGRMFFGAIFIFLFLLPSHQLHLIFTLNSKQVFWVLITAVILLVYVLSWYSGLKYIPVSKATIILLLGSPITTFLNLISGGKISQAEIISAILVIFGVVLVLGIKEIFEKIKELKHLIYVRT